MHFNVHYEYIHKGHKEKCSKSIFYKCRIVVVTYLHAQNWFWPVCQLKGV